MIIKRDIFFTPKNENRKLHIYLPNDYYNTDERYPVMYFFDGHNMFNDEDATYGKSWGMREFLDSWWKKIIIVGIECGHNGNERLSEYCPYSVNSGFAGYIEGIGDSTLNWMVNELKPVIDRDYRTYPHREATGIGGSSMGGLMALYGGIKYNTTFSKAACVSSAIGMCHYNLKRDLRETYINHDSTFFLSWGTEEAQKMPNPYYSQTAKHNLFFMHEFHRRGANAEVYCQMGGHHCEADWEKQIPIFMDYFWKY
ncbi:MAG: alpha/beta hydrolase-fold protein [Clostridia bacterium]|nr:alpha/beta hydrolase-fold protein [Clostridia bacterium]